MSKNLDQVVIGERIRKQREFLKLTREELAETACISTKFCYDLELGVKGMSSKTLYNISNALSTSCDYILKGNNNILNENKDIEQIVNILSQLPEDKLKYVIEMLVTFSKAIN